MQEVSQAAILCRLNYPATKSVLRVLIFIYSLTLPRFYGTHVHDVRLVVFASSTRHIFGESPVDLMQTYRYLRDHPLTDGNKFSAYMRFVKWQLSSRILNAPIAISYVNESRLFVRRGLHASTSTYYTGLKEFEEMGFVLHFLRSDDIFVDVGGNIGVFTILASAGVGATTYTFEPFPDTYRHLLDNINLNNGLGAVYPFPVCIGAEDGDTEFEIDRRSSSRNHVRPTCNNDKYGAGVIKVPMRTLDGMVDHPVSCLKVDVEGYEASVIAGAQDILDSPSLRAVIIEMNPSALRSYGHDSIELHTQMLSKGFETFRYNPLTRSLSSVSGFNTTGNTLYIRDPEFARARLKSAPAFSVLGQSI